MFKKISFIITSFFLLVGFTVPAKPDNGVYDPNHYLNSSVAETVNRANLQLANSEKKPQIAVIVIDSLKGESIETASLHTARTWKIGFSDTNMGALIFVSVKDRKMRIETSDEMATIVTDYQANQLLDIAKSDFRNNDYTQGVTKMVNGLLVTIGKALDITIDEQTTQQVERYMQVNGLTGTADILANVIQFAVMIGVVFFAVVALSGRTNMKRRGSVAEDLFWLSLFGSSSSRRSRRYYDDDDDDFFGGFGGGSSGGSSGGWSGGGFSGGGSSGGW